ncbi:MAG: hypothetical protein M1820_009215 [Bogoriella megaspora]|nr:MAG: hypothetical protein M1820_009215 [Bogoriella megaspora]
MPSDVLTNRDTNIQVQLASPQKVKQQSMHRQTLENTLKSDDEKSLAQNTYVSPSDTIMSPATQKLKAFKSKRLNEKANLTHNLFHLRVKPISFLKKPAEADPESSGSSEKNDGSTESCA